MKLSLLSILLGCGMAAPQVYGLARPKAFGEAARKLPRHLPTGIVLMLLGTAWFVWNVYAEPIADFKPIKPYLMAAFTGVGIGACFFVHDFLAARGMAVMMLLVAKFMVDTGRPHLGETPWVLVIQSWAYVLAVAGIYFTMWPWRMRDFLNWCTATEQRIKVGSTVRLAFAVFVVVLGLTVFRTM